MEELSIILVKLLATAASIGGAFLAAVYLSDAAAKEHHKKTDCNQETKDFVYRYHFRFYRKIIVYGMIPCLVLLWVGLK